MGLEVLLLVGGAYFLSRKKTPKVSNKSPAGFEQENIPPTTQQQLINSRLDLEIKQSVERKASEKVSTLSSIDQKEKEIDQLNIRIRDLQSQYSSRANIDERIKSNAQSRNKRIRESGQATLRSIYSSLNSINQQISSANTQKEKLQQEISTLRSSVVVT